MKKNKLLLSIFLLVVLLFNTATVASAQTPTPPPGVSSNGDQVVIANTYRLSSGDTLDGNLAVIAGTAVIEAGATISGDVFLVGGTVTINGTVNGEVIAIGGAVNINDSGILNGDVTAIGATINRSPLAKINGQIIEQSPAIPDFTFEQPVSKFPFIPESNQTVLQKVLLISIRSLIAAAIAALVGLLLPKPIQRIAASLEDQPGTAAGIGLLTIVGIPIIFAFVVILMTITIFLIPVVIIFILPITALTLILLVLTVMYGWIAIGFEVGYRITELLKIHWSTPISAGIGTLILVLVTGAANLIPCLGWILGFLVSLFGLGSVILGRFGSTRWLTKRVLPQTPAATPPAG